MSLWIKMKKTAIIFNIRLIRELSEWELHTKNSIDEFPTALEHSYRRYEHS